VAPAFSALILFFFMRFCVPCGDLLQTAKWLRKWIVFSTVSD